MKFIVHVFMGHFMTTFKKLKKTKSYPRKKLGITQKITRHFSLIDVIDVLANAMHSGLSPYLGIWTYFETNYAYWDIHYVKIPSRVIDQNALHFPESQ